MESKDQSMDSEGHIRRTANAPSVVHHILENFLYDIPAEPETKKKRNREAKKRGMGL